MTDKEYFDWVNALDCAPDAKSFLLSRKDFYEKDSRIASITRIFGYRKKKHPLIELKEIAGLE